MFIVFIIFTALVLYITLSIAATKTVSISQIHTEKQKRNYNLLIWGVPILGTISAMLLINKDIKKHRRKEDEEIAPAIRQIADQLNSLEKIVQQKRNKNQLH